MGGRIVADLVGERTEQCLVYFSVEHKDSGIVFVVVGAAFAFAGLKHQTTQKEEMKSCQNTVKNAHYT